MGTPSPARRAPRPLPPLLPLGAAPRSLPRPWRPSLRRRPVAAVWVCRRPPRSPPALGRPRRGSASLDPPRPPRRTSSRRARPAALRPPPAPPLASGGRREASRALRCCSAEPAAPAEPPPPRLQPLGGRLPGGGRRAPAAITAAPPRCSAALPLAELLARGERRFVSWLRGWRLVGLLVLPSGGSSAGAPRAAERSRAYFSLFSLKTLARLAGDGRSERESCVCRATYPRRAPVPG